ncbi:glycosyltransferase family 4 protein [Marinobacter bohaiensis]|uniref:glycosyltransferase family 4 protein n=1 Tax=Marinobacter bohaiensis TaxID=2201898 RepID=UPI000DAE6C3E|nr:glycosyltransferase family 4 protein [Marinobacter bohaiensis]
MRILHYVRQFHPSVGGIQDVVLQIARRQIAAGHEVEVLTLNRTFGSDEILPETDEIDGIRITRVPFRGIRQYPLVKLDLDTVNRFDVFHIHCVDSMLDKLIFLRRRIRGAVFLTTHGLYFHTEKFARIKRFFYRFVTPRALARVDRVFACSRNDYELIGRIIPDPERLMLVENGVALDKFLPAADAERSGDMVYIGRMAGHKNVEALIDRFLELDDDGRRLHLVGRDFDGTLPRLQARNLPERVVFHGSISTAEIAALAARCRYFVSASSFEGFGLSAVEAMGAGLIPILNDIPPFRELVDNHGGHLIDFGEPGSLAAVLRETAEAPALDDLGRRLQASVSQYSWDEKVRAILNQYQQCLARAAS